MLKQLNKVPGTMKNPFRRKKNKPRTVVKKFAFLSPKAVTSLANADTYQIARNLTFKDLEQIVQTLTQLYEDFIEYKKKHPEVFAKLKEQAEIEDIKSAYKSEDGKSLKKSNARLKAKEKKATFLAKRSKSKNDANVKKSKNGNGLQLNDADKIIQYTQYEIENALEKCDKALKTHQVYKQREKDRWETWEKDNKEKNVKAFEFIKSLVPEDLKSLTVEQLQKTLDGNVYLARRFIRHKVFQMYTMTEKELRSIHPVDLKNRYHIGGLDLTELRALYYLTKDLHREWRLKLRNKLYDVTVKQSNNELAEKQVRHPAYDNKPDFEHERSPSVVAFMRKASMASINSDNSQPSQLSSNNNLSSLNQNKNFSRDRGYSSLIAKEIHERKQRGKPPTENVVNSSRRIPNSQNISGKINEDKAAFEKVGAFYVRKQTLSDGDNDDENLDTVENLKADTNKVDTLLTDSIISQTIGNGTDKHAAKVAESYKKYVNQQGDNDNSTNTGKNKISKDARNNRAPSTISMFDFDDDNFAITPSDTPESLRRKQSDLFKKAFEMINSEDVKDDDEIFLKTLRRISTISSTLSDDATYADMSEVADEDDNDNETSEHENAESENYYASVSTKNKTRSNSAASDIASFYTEPEYKKY